MKERNKVANGKLNMQGETSMQKKARQVAKKEKMFARGGGTD